MKRIRLLGLTLFAVFALGALASSSAFADPTILPEPKAGEPIKFTSESTKVSELETTTGGEAKVIKCQKATNVGEFTTANSGTITINFKECKQGAVNCKTKGAANIDEIVLANAEFKLVDVLPTGTLDLGIWINPKNLEITCGVVVIVILGQVIGVADNKAGELLASGAKAKEFKILFKREVKEAKEVAGEQQIKTCMEPVALCVKEGKEVPFELKAKLNVNEELAVQVADANITFTKEVAFDF